VEGKTVQVISPGFLKERGPGSQDERLKRIAEKGTTVVYVLVGGAACQERLLLQTLFAQIPAKLWQRSRRWAFNR